MQEKEQADRDLQAAIPYLRKAEQAVNSIKPGDINELKQMRQAVDTTRLIMDTVQLLFQRAMDPVKMKTLVILKKEILFVADSYNNGTELSLKSPNFLKDLFEFSEKEKDNINEETVELLQPYVDLQTPDGVDIFVGAVAKKSSAALEGMCVWAAAMSDYYKQSKIVKPKLILLERKMGELKDAEDNLAAAENELAEVSALKERLRKKFDGAMGEKMAL
jgi:dynein heavy chain